MRRFLIALAALPHLLTAASCVSVEGSQIVAKDVAQVDPAFAAVSAEFPFSYAPVIGHQRMIPASEIASWAAKVGVKSEASTPACFERIAHPLTAADVEKAIREAFPRSDITEVEVVEICRCDIPAGRLIFTADGASVPATGQADGPSLWRGQLAPSSGSPYPVWARVRVLARSTVVRLRQNLRAREVIKREDVEQLEVTGSVLRLRPDSTENYIGKSVNRDLRAGSNLDPAVVTPLPDIVRGSTVTVEVVNGATRLQLKARAESAGRIGDTVVLTNPAGLRTFHGIVTGPGLVQVALSPAASLDRTEKNPSIPATISGGTL